MDVTEIAFLVVGFCFGLVLLAIGYLIGRRRSVGEASRLMGEDERHRMVGLLHGLARWANEYSGSVTQYQHELGQLTRMVKQNLSVDRDGRADEGDARLASLLEEIMSSNEQLQSRLDAAEQQLEQQTQQLESYLTEARTDGLTGLANRRAFDKKLDELFALYRRGGSPFTLILVDIDQFKAINDNHGHPVGDVVLQRIAGLLQEGLPDALIVSRYGGEEFAALTDAPLRAASQQCDALRKTIARNKIATDVGPLSTTISVGLSRPHDELAVGPLVHRADEALYTAKKIGRNRVYFNDGGGAQLVGAPEVVRPSPA